MIKDATEEDILNFFNLKYSQRKQKIWAYYNSDLNKIIYDEKYMLIPADDRLAVRGHGAFDALCVKNMCIINLEAHVDRLYASCKSVQINPPF